MKSVAKIILGFSLIALAACSGKGSGESRINNIEDDGNDTTKPAVIDGDENHGNGSTSGTFACSYEAGTFCAEATDSALKSECTSRGGTLTDKCPAGGEVCHLTGVEGIEKATFYIYNNLTTCGTLQLLVTMDDDEEDYDDFDF